MSLLSPYGKNITKVIIPRGIYTNSFTTEVFLNSKFKGIHLYVKVFHKYFGQFQPMIEGQCCSTGCFYKLLIGSALTSTSNIGELSYIYRIYPGLTPGMDVVNDVLPTLWRVNMIGTKEFDPVTNKNRLKFDLVMGASLIN